MAFPFFSSLPQELQDKVWRSAIPDARPYAHEVAMWIVGPNMVGDLWPVFDDLGRQIVIPRSPTHRHLIPSRRLGPLSTHPHPDRIEALRTLLQTTQDSRHVAETSAYPRGQRPLAIDAPPFQPTSSAGEMFWMGGLVDAETDLLILATLPILQRSPLDFPPRREVQYAAARYEPRSDFNQSGPMTKFLYMSAGLLEMSRIFPNLRTLYVIIEPGLLRTEKKDFPEGSKDEWTAGGVDVKVERFLAAYSEDHGDDGTEAPGWYGWADSMQTGDAPGEVDGYVSVEYLEVPVETVEKLGGLVDVMVPMEWARCKSIAEAAARGREGPNLRVRFLM